MVALSKNAVKAGYTTGIFDNWVECQKATRGYSGPNFNKFATLAEAEAYMNDIDIAGEAIRNDISNGYIFDDALRKKDPSQLIMPAFILKQSGFYHMIKIKLNVPVCWG